MTHYIAECEPDDIQELADLRRAERRYYRQLGNHPDPRDPDHPEIDNEGEDE